MNVKPAAARHIQEHAGKNYYFCCASCKEKFKAEPVKYLSALRASGLEMPGTAAGKSATVPSGEVTPPVLIAAAKSSREPAGMAAAFVCPMCPEIRQSKPGACPSCGMALEPEAPVASARVEYTCPMHPEIVRSEPSSCPICGMTLEPRTVIAAPEENSELRDMTRRLWISLALTAPLLTVAMYEMIPGLGVHPARIFGIASPWPELMLATPVVLWAGWPFFRRFWTSLVNRSPNMFTLIGMGTGVAYVYSVIATLAPGIFPVSLRTMSGHPDVYFEAAAAITTLVLLGQVMELRARTRTSAAIRALLDLSPRTARLLAVDGSEEDVPLEQIKPGDRLRVRAGEKIPVDGVVLEGRSAIDESAITGESIPLEKKPDSQVIGGTINTTGSFIMRAERVGSETLLAQIVRMVSQAQRSRAPIQRLADRVSGWFVPAVIAVAVVTFFAWGTFGPQPRLAHALVNAVAVLIIACPCALGLATPMAITVGVGRGAHGGVLIKNAEALEILEKIDTLVVDKTGTLTEGRPRVVSVSHELANNAELLRAAGSLERASEHPVASAVVDYVERQGLKLSEPQEFKSVPGRGLIGVVDGKSVAVGNVSLMVDVGALKTPAVLAGISLTGSILCVAVDGKYVGNFGVEDTLKPTTANALRGLKDAGVHVLMLTGDNKATAAKIAQKLGIEFEAEVLPQQKLEIVRKLQEQGRVVAMAGDGINDAPALAQANVGIAMGTGTDVAMESGSITLLKGNLSGILQARKLSQATMRNIRQNLFFAFIYNAIGVPIAAGVLYPFFGLLLSPIFAAAAMSFSSVSVILNALRLRNLKL